MLQRAVLALAIVIACTTATAAPQYRAFWVETFHTPFVTRVDVDRILSAATKAKANAIFMEVRRRGDAWYFDAAEPRAEVLSSDFDPLRYLIDEAHARKIQVHAFTIVGSVWQGDPAKTLPRDPKHVFLQHVWNPMTNAPYDDDRQWGTRTREGNYRFGSEWYIDLGNPEAAAYTVDVLAHLASAYDIDGVHLDRVRYPENRGGDVGYNDANVQRFNAKYDRTGLPAPNDPLWCEWRRDQVTNFVRSLHDRIKTIRPSIQISAALITYGRGPHGHDGFETTDAYANVFQDWRKWSDERIVDLLCPMIYKRETVARQRRDFDDWLRFLIATAHRTNRIALAGVAAYLNTVHGISAQTQRATAAGVDGVIYFALRPHA
ncbi:MAG TPA: family 10 glycosylhydrolase [Thermoanaerobaculia bacterium]|nr:family 10 glycosylhydrolase [Thermoanaerobaculia bacterium]